jgi:hypothetical protein
MIIHKPVINNVDNSIVRVSSFIESEKNKNLSRTLWYEFPSEYVPADNSNAFLIATIIFAMAIKEDITVLGSSSPKLIENLKYYQEYFNFWYPKKLKIINITSENIKEEKPCKTVVSLFSGGVDAFYTLYDRLSEINYCILINGFDIINKDYFINPIIKEYKEFLERYNKKLIPVRTNIRESLNNTINAMVNFGSIIISCASILNSICGKLYVSSSHTYRGLTPDGSNATIDHLLSTESQDVINYGTNKSRFEKMKKIIQWPETYDKLRVCVHSYSNDMSLINCCHCDKCIRTMLHLELLGELQKYNKAFTLPLNVKNWPNDMRYVKEIRINYMHDALKMAVQNNRLDLIEDIKYVLNTIKTPRLSVEEEADLFTQRYDIA